MNIFYEYALHIFQVDASPRAFFRQVFWECPFRKFSRLITAAGARAARPGRERAGNLAACATEQCRLSPHRLTRSCFNGARGHGCSAARSHHSVRADISLQRPARRGGVPRPDHHPARPALLPRSSGEQVCSAVPEY